MEIDDKGLPIHKDATLKIRPRIFLEGNFFVDLKPGTPSRADDRRRRHAADHADRRRRCSSTRCSPRCSTTRARTSRPLLEGYGTALTYKPTAADDAGQDPDVQRQDGGRRRSTTSFDYAPDALRGDGDRQRGAPRHRSPHDLSKLVKGLGKVTAALDRNESQLQDLVTNFNTTMARVRLASTQPAARRSALLGPTLRPPTAR